MVGTEYKRGRRTRRGTQHRHRQRRAHVADVRIAGGQTEHRAMIPGLIAPPDKPTDHEHHARHRGGHGKKADQAFRTRWYRPDRLEQQRRQRQIKDEGIQPALLISTVAQQNLSDNTR